MEFGYLCLVFGDVGNVLLITIGEIEVARMDALICYTVHIIVSLSRDTRTQ